MNQTELARKLGTTKGNLSKWKAAGCPVDDFGKAQLWVRANIAPGKDRKGFGDEPPKDIPPAAPPDYDPDHSWDAVVSRAKTTEVAAANAVLEAIKSKETAQLQRLMSAHAQSIQSRKDAEKIATEARVGTGELIHRDTVRAIWREVIPPIKSAIERLPVTARSRCNPDNPEVAENALKSEIKSILGRISKLETKF